MILDDAAAFVVRSASPRVRVSRCRSMHRTIWRCDPHEGGSKDAARTRQGAPARLAGKLYASDTWSVLIILQAMDAAGKDSTIEHVMSGVNPQGCQVFSFKAPRPRSLTTISSGARPAPARAGAHRHPQPLLLRGGAGGARAPGVLEGPAPAAEKSVRGRARLQDFWAERLQAIATMTPPRAERHEDHQVLPACLERGAEGAPARAH